MRRLCCFILSAMIVFGLTGCFSAGAGSSSEYDHGYSDGRDDGRKEGYSEGFRDGYMAILNTFDEDELEQWCKDNGDVIRKYNIET